MAPMGTRYGSRGGYLTEKLRAYYEARARGGTGLITVEATFVKPEGRLGVTQLGAHEDGCIPGLTTLAESIKSHGTRASIELNHGGIQANPAAAPRIEGPAAIRRKNQQGKPLPKKLTTEEVEEIVELFGDAAVRCQSAGFDMVQVHGTHGYLVNEFLSPVTNRRSDKYGMDRLLFAKEIVQNIKQKCGSAYPVDFRLCADEFLEGGITIDLAIKHARALENVGVDKFNVTAGTAEASDLNHPSMYLEKGDLYDFFNLAAEIKSVVDVPVSSGALITKPEQAEQAINRELVDMVFLGRQFITDPDWVRKAKRAPEDIRPCIACNDGCIGRIVKNKPIWCTVNTFTGYEYNWPNEEHLPRPSEKRKVLIIGAGPAGLEAARIAAIRGHEVSIVDEKDQIGGLLNTAAVPKFKKRLKWLIDWYKVQLKKLDVALHLRTKATPETIEEFNPDAVIVATGSEPLVPELPGVNKAVTADEVLRGEVEVGKTVAIAGAGLVGCETALYLVNQGKDVTLVEALEEIARDMAPQSRLSFVKSDNLLKRQGVRVLTEQPIVEITDTGLIALAGTQRKTVKADTVILALGRSPSLSNELVKKAEEVAERVDVIGDASEPRKALEAIHEGFTIGREL